MWRDLRMATATAAVALLVYWLTLAPTVTSEDSGELITAAHSLGVPHPPGYPAWTLMAAVWAHLPGLSAAYGVNLMSAAFGAATVALTYLVGRALSCSPSAAAVGALCLAFSERFWSQAVIAEVYTMNTAALGGVLLGLVQWARTRRPAWLHLSAATFGLALANHHMLTLLVTPALTWFLWRVRAPGLPGFRILVTSSALIAAGLALYAYLPIAASRSPAMNWGDPSTLSAFWAHVTRASYRDLEFAAQVTVADKLEFMAHFVVLATRQFTPWLLALVGAGLWSLKTSAGTVATVAHIRRRAPELLLSVILLNSVALLLILRFQFSADNRSRVEEYYLPAYLCLSLLIGAGTDAALAAWARLTPLVARTRLAPLNWLTTQRATVLLCLLPALPLEANFLENDRSRDFLAYDFNFAALASLEANAVLYTSGDYTSFPSLYLQSVEGHRRDVLLADPIGTPSRALLEYARAQDPGVNAGDLATVFDAVLSGPRPVYVSSRSELKGHASLHVVPCGLVYRVMPTTVPHGAPGLGPPPDLLAVAPLRNAAAPPALNDLGRGILVDYHVMRAEALNQRDDRAGAESELRRAADFITDDQEAFNNLGALAADLGFLALGERFLRAAAGLDERYVTPRRNLAQLLTQRQRAGEAREFWRSVAKLDPADSRASELSRTPEAAPASREPRRPTPLPPASEPESVGAGTQLTDPDERVRHYESVTRAEPENAAAWNNLGSALAESGDLAGARSAYQHALNLDGEYDLARRNLARLLREHFVDPDSTESD